MANMDTDGANPTGQVIHQGRAKGSFAIDKLGSVPTQGMAWVKFVVSHDDATADRITLAAGDIVHAVQVHVTESWDGNGHFDLGDADDPDGYYDAANAKINSTGWKIDNNDDFGVYLWDSTGGDTHPLTKFHVAAKTVKATVTTGTSAQGEANVYVLISRLSGS